MNEDVIYAEGGHVIKLDDDLAEVIVSDGIEVTAEMVDECGQLLLDNFRALLIIACGLWLSGWFAIKARLCRQAGCLSKRRNAECEPA